MQKQYSVMLDLYSTGVLNTNILYEINDNNVYPLFISLRSNRGTFKIPVGATISVNFKNEKGETFPDLATIINNDTGRVFFNVNNEGLSLTGKITVYLHIITVDQRLSFQPFTFAVWQSPTAGATPPPIYQSWVDGFNARLSDHEARILGLEQNGGGETGGVTIEQVDIAISTHNAKANAHPDLAIVTPNVLWVDQSRKNDDINSEIGTMANPFITLQDAFDIVDKDMEIQVSSGDYNEHLTWNKPYKLILTADGTKGFYPVNINGNFTIAGTASIVAIQNMQINGDFTNDAPNSIFIPGNIRINGVSNFNNGDYIIDDSYFNNINSTTIKNVTIRNSESEASGSWKFYGISARIRLTSIENLYADHVEGKLTIDGNTTFKPVSGNIGLRSSATNANRSTLSIVSGNFKQEDATFAKCQKTGDCDYVLSSNVLLDRFSTFNGVRSFAGINIDQVKGLEERLQLLENLL